MKRLPYKGNKWDKEVSNVNRLKKEIKGNFNRNKENTINDFIEYGSEDYLFLYFMLKSDYSELARLSYLDNIDNESIIKYGYLSGLAAFLSLYLYEKGVRSQTYDNDIIRDTLSQMEDAIIFRLLSFDIMPVSFFESKKDCLIVHMYKRDYQKALNLLNKLPDDYEETKEIYYESPVFLKKIYLAIINQDEKAFNEELEKRIKKYRRNMVGYSTIIDYVSIALIKLAKREGIQCDVDVIEIPKQFFEKKLLACMNINELPYYTDLLKTGMLDGFNID